MVCLCYNSSSCGEQVEPAKSCLAQVLSALEQQQKSHNGNCLKTLPTGLRLALSCCGCIVSSIQALRFEFVKNVYMGCGYNSECKMYPLLLEGATKCHSECMLKSKEHWRSNSGVRTDWLQWCCLMLSVVLVLILILGHGRVQCYCLSLATFL